jgi:thiamine biosynthesis lipoprotein
MPNRRPWILALALLGTACAPGRAQEPGPQVRRRLLAMGTELCVLAAAPQRSVALRASESAAAAVADAERRLSTWRDDSELARLNQAAAGTDVPLSPELAQDLADCIRWSRETAGAFDPACGALCGAWQLRSGGRRPEPSALTAALASSGVASTLSLSLSSGRATACWLRSGASIEEGGFGKGVALDAAAAALRSHGASGWISLGGQVAAVGMPVDFEVAHPCQRTAAVLRLSLHEGSAATSGNSERGLVIDGRRVGHILDPRTGWPAEDFGTVTVWHKSAAAADALSTAAYVMGPERALAWASEREDCELFVALPIGDRVAVTATPGLRGRLTASHASVSLTFYEVDR